MSDSLPSVAKLAVAGAASGLSKKAVWSRPIVTRTVRQVSGTSAENDSSQKPTVFVKQEEGELV